MDSALGSHCIEEVTESFTVVATKVQCFVGQATYNAFVHILFINSTLVQ